MLRQLYLWQAAWQHQPAVVSYNYYTRPALLKEHGDAGLQRTHLGRDEMRELPPVLMAVAVNITQLGPGAACWVAKLITLQHLEALLHQQLPEPWCGDGSAAPLRAWGEARATDQSASH